MMWVATAVFFCSTRLVQLQSKNLCEQEVLGTGVRRWVKCNLSNMFTTDGRQTN